MNKDYKWIVITTEVEGEPTSTLLVLENGQIATSQAVKDYADCPYWQRVSTQDGFIGPIGELVKKADWQDAPAPNAKDYIK